MRVPSEFLWKLDATYSMTAASMSFTASSILAFAMARSTTPASGGREGETRSPLLKSSVWHRIIFGVSVADIIQSLGILTGPFSVPSDVPQALWSLGNVTSCRISGFMFNVGSMSVPMYILFFAYYCLCKVKQRMDDTDFACLEWKVHIFIVLFTVGICTASLLTDSVQSCPYGIVCTFSASPAGCQILPELYGECDRRSEQYAQLYYSILLFGVYFFCFIGIVICMFQVCWYVIFVKKSMNQGLRLTTDHETLSPYFERGGRGRVQHLERIQIREFFIQASLYVSVYLITYVFWMVLIMFIVLKTELPPLWIATTAAIFYPIGGVLNILVYFRPKALTLMKNHSRYSWFQALVLVIRAGGIIPGPNEMICSDVLDQEVDESYPSHDSSSAFSGNGSGQLSCFNLSSSGLNDDPCCPEAGEASTKSHQSPLETQRKFYNFPIKERLEEKNTDEEDQFVIRKVVSSLEMIKEENSDQDNDAENSD